MPEEEISIERRVELVKNSIAKIQKAEDFRRDVNADPGSGSMDCWRAAQWFKNAEAEFAWQWKNVSAIFKEKGIE